MRVFYLGVHQNVHQFPLLLFFTLGLPNESPARGPSQSQSLSKSCPLPGNLILPGTFEGFGREARSVPGGYAPGHDTDGGPHPNSFEPTGVAVNIAFERPSGLVQEDTWIRIQSSRACSADA